SRHSLQVHLADRAGNKQTTGGQAAGLVLSALALDGVTQIPSTWFVTDLGTGAYTLGYSVPEVDAFLLHVEFDGQAILGSPFTVVGYRRLAVVRMFEYYNHI